MMEYWKKSSDKLIQAFVEHVQLVSLAMMFALLFSLALVALIRRWPNLRNGSIYLLSVIYAIPSLAVFALLIPVTGLGKTTAIIVLVVYVQYILVRNILLGLDQVDDRVLEVADAMGMTQRQVLHRVQIPLAMPTIVTGLKISTTSTVGIATMAAVINGGGLGKILFEGLRTMDLIKLVWGTLLTVILCLLVNIFWNLLYGVLKKVHPYF
ncbi:ABC transporter permease [Eremococcus coleocola]|uniref:ABC transporter, permease protein n=1 Tax=Eremococcus coleocola ACS-139-V-Col8 TaxID=908337 RepID=E4KPR9_9LACT|nr:ABC transporter permease [Eremococcus coleocola]EFR31356.1 ABC transporter, permease protein [Eremococcus coleocola ACS-139-V-Col8]